MIQKYQPSNKDICIGNLFVHNYRRDITVTVIDRFDGGLKIFTSNGKVTIWGLASFCSTYRMVI